MNRLIIAAVAACGLLAAAPAFAQAAPACPGVAVNSPDTAGAGEAFAFTAMVTGGDPDVTPTYNWSVSAGTIEFGQGTSTITLSAPADGNTTVTATADVGGYARECATAASATTMINAPGT